MVRIELMSTPAGFRRRRAAAVLAGAALLVACGDDGPDPGVAAPSDGGVRRVQVSMTEMSFSPASLDVEVGETITFEFHNDGVVRHEAVLGDEATQEAHGAEMSEMSDMAEMSGMGGHDEGESDGHGPEASGTADVPAVVVEPGATAELTVTFDTPGPMVIGCHEPGHWEAGMRMDVDV